ncbi:MAG: phospholipid carrier-dependent glycosyltransferase [Planctomycetes bacterium]|nr:phospholipid carrier-dependent glycosyltransferase [Planctomycetota bacterium]
MKFLASVKVRLFLICWIVYSTFFATNVVREHYPAFALIDRGDWVCDRYAGMHWDLFRHTDGHVYTGNNVMGSLIAVPPLLVFDPLLDRLEQHSLAKLAEARAAGREIEATYDTRYPLRQKMFRQVKEAGLDLRFGASTAITSAFLMAPLCAGLVVLMYATLRARSVARERAVWLAFLFAFATPVFYRSAHLNHNVFLMVALFGAFLLLWPKPGEREPLSISRRAWAGFLCGMALSLDYAGVVPAGMLALYFVVSRARRAGLACALREALPCVLAALPPLVFLLGTQWAMYGDAFTPGQFVMPKQNEYVDIGTRGIALPSPEIFLKNLLSPSWGLVPFAPLLVFAFIGAGGTREEQRVLPRRERVWVWLLATSFAAFCAMNVYSLLQFNTGFRYLLPLVPLLFLLAADPLARLERRWLAALSCAVVFHAVVLSMTRHVSDTENDLRKAAVQLGVEACELEGYWTLMLSETPVPQSFVRLCNEGPQLPWLTVLRQTSPHVAWLGNPLLPAGVLFAVGALCVLLWRLGSRAERAGGA